MASRSSATSSPHASTVPETSAGVLLFRRSGHAVEILLVHPGGPFWARKDDGAWSIPKGLYDAGEDAFLAARREFEEEIGTPVPGDMLKLADFTLPSGKRLSVWLSEGDLDATTFTSNLFEMEWPPLTGKRAQFPEIDRAGWFKPDEALVKVTKGQRQVIEAFLFQIR